MKPCFLVARKRRLKSHRSTFVAPAIKFNSKSHESSTGCELTQFQFDMQSNWKVFSPLASYRRKCCAEANKRRNIGTHKLHGMNRHVFRDIWRLIRIARVPVEKCYWEGYADKWHLSWNGRIAKMSRDHCWVALADSSKVKVQWMRHGAELIAKYERPEQSVLHFMNS